MNSTQPNKTERVNPLATTVKSALYFLGGLFFAWNLLVLYAFATMGDPDPSFPKVIRRILLENGIQQTILFIGLLTGALACFALCARNLWSRVTGVQTETKTSRNSLGILVLAVIVLGLLYFAFA